MVRPFKRTRRLTTRPHHAGRGASFREGRHLLQRQAEWPPQWHQRGDHLGEHRDGGDHRHPHHHRALLHRAREVEAAQGAAQQEVRPEGRDHGDDPLRRGHDGVLPGPGDPAAGRRPGRARTVPPRARRRPGRPQPQQPAGRGGRRRGRQPQQRRRGGQRQLHDAAPRSRRRAHPPHARGNARQDADDEDSGQDARADARADSAQQRSR
ncbi:hypothetical protein FOCC_FOCC012932, partial [Frankliniella occidentalis]